MQLNFLHKGGHEKLNFHLLAEKQQRYEHTERAVIFFSYYKNIVKTRLRPCSHSLGSKEEIHYACHTHIFLKSIVQCYVI